MKKWIQSILSSEGDQSSKRLIGLYCIITGSIMAWIGTFTEYKTPEYMYNTLIYTGAGAFIGTVVESVFTQKFLKPKPAPEPQPETTDEQQSDEKTLQ